MTPGLACSITSSAGYGSGVVVPGTGIWLNNSLGEVDLLRAVGYLHGRSRFFQMDTLRRYARGRLSELTGAQRLPLATVPDLVAGDHYIVQGQSNAASNTQSGDPNAEHQGPFVRSFGRNVTSGAVCLQSEGAVIHYRNIELVPTLTAGRQDERTDLPDGDLEEGEGESELGLTASWGVSPTPTSRESSPRSAVAISHPSSWESAVAVHTIR